MSDFEGIFVAVVMVYVIIAICRGVGGFFSSSKEEGWHRDR